MDTLSDKINHYCETHTTSENAVLQELVRESHLKTLVPRMLSGHLQGRFLSLISHLMRPQRILEIGTFTGYAAHCLAEGLAENGILYTIEGNDELESIIKKHIEKANLGYKIKSIIGNALEIIPSLNEVFDLVFIDAGKRDYPAYYDMCIDTVRSGGLIIADNVLWSGKVLDEKKDTDTQILDAFNKKIHADPRVECLLLPLRDGLMIARKI
jgi:caffeoyl-CoA O-methyltransferase